MCDSVVHDRAKKIQLVITSPKIRQIWSHIKRTRFFRCHFAYVPNDDANTSSCLQKEFLVSTTALAQAEPAVAVGSRLLLAGRNDTTEVLPVFDGINRMASAWSAATCIVEF